MLMRNFIFWLSTKKSVTDGIARYGTRYGFARRFVVGETLDQALPPTSDLARSGRRVILNLLGENVTTAEEAKRACAAYLEMLTTLAAAHIDGNISIKLTQLGLDFDPGLCLSLVQQIAAAAESVRRPIEIDMEQSSYTSRTLDIFETTVRQYAHTGVAIQAYLRRSEADIQRLAALTAAKPKIRLVKGAYLEPPSVAFQKKSEVDANYSKLLDLLLSPRSGGGFFTAVATHDPALVAYAKDLIARHKLTAGDYEFQMIYGIRRDLQQQVFSEGYTLRVYVPFGSAWCPYFMRRLSERPANVWFVLRSLLAERHAAK
jgi:proline dehydrogenase